MSGRTSVVTGATGALGLEVASALARHGGRVVLLGRDRARLRLARAQVARAARPGPAEVEVLLCDLASLASVRAAGAAVALRQRAVHTLVHCAGVFSATRRTSADGYELMLATNCLAPALLTLLLRDALCAARSARVVFVSPVHEAAPPPEGLVADGPFAPLRAFIASRRLTLSFASQLAARWRGAISVVAVDPGPTRSGLLREAPLPLRAALAVVAAAPARAAAPVVYAAISPAIEGTTGVCLRRGEVTTMAGGDTEADRRAWELTVALLRTRPPTSAAA